MTYVDYITHIKMSASGRFTLEQNWPRLFSLHGNTSVWHHDCNEEKSLLSKNIKINIYKTIILPVVFYGCENWSDTLREQRRLRMFEKGVLRKIILGFKREELIRECRRLHNEEFCDLFF